MMLMTESGIMAEADARVFQMLMSADRTTRRLMAADRTVAGAYRRVATLRRMQEAKASLEHAKADRELAKELGAKDTARGWGRTFKVKATASPAHTRSSPARAAARASTSTRAIRAYAGPLLDRRGRVALFMDIKYRGLKSKGWRAGLSADHIDYIMRALALEMAAQQLDRPISNMGESIEEIMACWRALEAIEQGYRANAKVQYRIVWNLPHELDAEQRRALVEDFCERTFGRLGLPYAAAIHEPDADGDQRNYHAHITFSTRPCERTGDHEWAISEEKVNGLTNQAGLRLVRALGAAHMNRACRAAGLSTLYTHQTYAERGIDARRQKHVGPAAMAAHDRGEAVAVIAGNAAIVALNEATVAGQRIERQLDANRHLLNLLERAERDANRPIKIGVRIAVAARMARQAGAVVARLGTAGRQNRLIERTKVAALQSHIGTVRRSAVVPVRRVAPTAVVETVRHRAVEVQRRLAEAIRRAMPAMPLPAIPIVGHLQVTVHAMGQRLAALPPTQAAAFQVRLESARNDLTHITDAHRRIGGRARHGSMVEGYRAIVDAVDRRRVEHRHSLDAERDAAIRTTIMESPAIRCTVTDSKLRADLTALSVEQRLAFDGLDRAVQRQLLLDRHEADKRRAVEADATKQAAEASAQREREQAAQRSAAIAEACRILRESVGRPYRRTGKTVHTDWTTLAPTERAIIMAVGIAEPKVQAALRERIAVDARADAIASSAHDAASTPRRTATAPAEVPASASVAEPLAATLTSTAAVDNRLERVANPKPRVTRADILVAASFQRDALREGWNRTGALHEAGRANSPATDNPVDVDLDRANRNAAIRRAIQHGLGSHR